MGTQGVVTVTRGGRVVLKVIAGSDGQRAEVLANSLRRRIRDSGRIPSAGEAYDMAEMLGFGGAE